MPCDSSEENDDSLLDLVRGLRRRASVRQLKDVDAKPIVQHIEADVDPASEISPPTVQTRTGNNQS